MWRPGRVAIWKFCRVASSVDFHFAVTGIPHETIGKRLKLLQDSKLIGNSTDK